MKVLFIVNECNPEWTSVPLLSYNIYNALSRLVDITLVTHERNKSALEKVRGKRRIHYIKENHTTSAYYNYMSKHVFTKWNNWPLHHMLSYPVYAEFNHKVYNRFRGDVERGDYNIVHALTPILPRYPVKIQKACRQKTPFILGPVNGGLPFPDNFGLVAKKESAHFNFLRYFSNLIPGYKATYQKAKIVFAGSSYTQALLQKMFSINPPKLKLFFENGISQEFLSQKHKKVIRGENAPFNLLFVGRLVPYKGADMILSALSMVEKNIREKLFLTIVGDGPEKINLKKQAIDLHLEEQVRFTGWVDHRKTLEYYRDADVFCFPSVREFGGAVVLEAMATGLPSIVVNHGGISEYVTSETGFKIDPLSKDHIIHEIKNILQHLISDKDLYGKLSEKACLHASKFEWNNKAEQMVAIYQKALL